jgi:hypothetical protein
VFVTDIDLATTLDRNPHVAARTKTFAARILYIGTIFFGRFIIMNLETEIETFTSIKECTMLDEGSKSSIQLSKPRQIARQNASTAGNHLRSGQSQSTIKIKSYLLRSQPSKGASPIPG